MANFHPIISPPKYVQVSDYIKGNIESGEYPVGSKLASQDVSCLPGDGPAGHQGFGVPWDGGNPAWERYLCGAQI